MFPYRKNKVSINSKWEMCKYTNSTSIYHEAKRQKIIFSKLRNFQSIPSKQFLGPKYLYFIKKITDNNLLLFFSQVLCRNSITGNLKHHYPGQFPIIMLEMELNFRFPIPSPKWELNVTEQNVTQWDRILKYVTVSRCFPNKYHTAKSNQKNEVQRFSQVKGPPRGHLAH